MTVTENKNSNKDIAELPRGYYAVVCDSEVLPESFVFQGISYSVSPGENIFKSAQQAINNSVCIPSQSLPGMLLPHTPVILFSSGKHLIDGLTIDRSLTFWGQGAGISPSLDTVKSFEAPPKNPQRYNAESVIYGTFYRGTINLSEPLVTELTFDGFTSQNARFRDRRTLGSSVRLIFKNIIHEGPCGYVLYAFSKPRTDGGIEREVVFENIRLEDFDALDYGSYFVEIAAENVLFKNILIDNTDLYFGLSDPVGNFSNSITKTKKARYRFESCFFKNMDGGINLFCRDLLRDCMSDCEILFELRNTCFEDVGKQGEPVISAMLANDLCRLTVDNCCFKDTQKSREKAVLIKGNKDGVYISENSIFDGFVSACSAELNDNASDIPKLIEGMDKPFLTGTEDGHECITAVADFDGLDEHYAKRKAYYGDLHVHTSCGGTSDGAYPMGKWCSKMDELGLDFVVIVDHGQMRGFFLPEWNEERFVMGTEPGTSITDLNACRSGQSEMHYNMLFPHKYSLAMVLANFPEFKFHGDELTGRFRYPNFTKERFGELVGYVRSIGGIVVHAHPKVMMCSDDPLDYYFGENTFLETIYGDPSSVTSIKNYELWKKLLALGKHVYASSGSDTHTDVSNKAIAVFYTSERHGSKFFEQMRSGDFTVGCIGIKMCIDEFIMGSTAEYREGMTLNLRVGDFFAPSFKKDNKYELRVITDKGIAYCSVFDGTEEQRLALKVQKRAFYRAEIFDVTGGYRVAISNPIWLV